MTARPYQTLGTRIAVRRQEKRMSQADLAKEADLGRGLIGDVERGVKRPSSEGLRRIARVLDIDFNELVVDAGYMEKPPAGSPLMVPEDVLDDLRDIAAQPPAIVKALRGMMRELKIMYLASGRTDGDPSEDVRGR